MDPASGDAGKSRPASSSSSAAASAQQAQAQAAAAALGLLDPSALFAHSLFAAGIPASYNPMTPMPGYGLLGQGAHFSQASSASQANAQAQAAWWSMASQMAAQDYLSRLQHAAVSASSSSGGGGSSSGRNGASSSAASQAGFAGLGAFPGLGGADSLLAGYASAASGASKSSGKSRASSANPVVRDSLNTSAPGAASTSSASGKSRQAASSASAPADKFAAPESAGQSRKNGSSSKSRKRSATVQDASAVSMAASAASPASSLSSLSSMAMSYPFFSNPLASLSLPPGLVPPVAQSSPAEDKKKSSKKERHSVDSQARLTSSSATTSSTSTTTTASVTTNNNNNNSTKARSQTVNGKPLALDVSSLIGKPTASSSSSSGAGETEAPLNLSMKTTTSKEPDAQPASSSSSSGSQSRLGRGVSMPKKNTVASLLAQSRNQRSSSPAGSASQAPAAHAASSPSASELKAMKDNLALYTAMQELSNPKYSNALLNGIKDSLNPGQSDANHAIQDLLRAASLLGGFGLPAGALAGLAGLSAPPSKSSSSSTSAQAPANSKAQETGKSSVAGDSSAASTPSKTNEKHGDRDDKTPTPSKAENGKSSEQRASGNNGKTNHDHDAHLTDDSDSMDEDDSMMDSEDEEGGDGSRKRSADGGDGDQPSKKRRCVSDEAALRVPLSLGWKRETLIRSISKSGVRGEVTYYSPSGRRFRQYPDVVRYLERQNMGNLKRDNFSFSTRCIVGEFVQPLGDSGNSRGIRLGEPEVRHLVDQIRIARGWKPRSRRMTDEEKEAMNREKEAQRVAQRLEAQELARQAQEAKLQQRMERERALQEAKEARRIAKEQEKLERQEAQRRERELRTQQLMEARKKRQEELDRMREEEQQRKIQELNKQRELFYTAELERERKRQHTAIVKALEARKRYEERERRREEMRAEKRAEKEKKLEERRREQESWKDQRSPAEDMSLTDHKPLTRIPRIQNLKLPGKAFADVLMLYEFLNTFGETLGFDMDSLPSLDSLQKALLYDSEAEEELLSVMTHLLVCAIEDPGIPHPNRHTTLLGQTLKQADITTTNVSEILRIYLQANGLGDIKLSDRTSSPNKAAITPADCPDSEAFAMSEWLKRKPFLSLSPTQKAAVLGFLVNELLQNKAVIGQIDSAIEGQNTARRDRWIVDSKIKKLKTLHSKKSRHSASMAMHALIKHEHLEDGAGHDETNQSAASGAPPAKKAKADEAPEEEHADEADEDSGAEADDAATEQDDEDESLPADELKKKVERLSRQSNQMLTQLALSDLQLRALNMGQDRFRRRMWILPHAGGVYLEAMESGEANAGALGTWDGKPVPPVAPPCDDDEILEDPVNPEVKQDELKSEINEQSSSVEAEADNKENIKTEQPAVKQEQTDEQNDVVKKEETIDVKTESEPDAVEALPALWFSLFPRNPCDARSIVKPSNGATDTESTHGDADGCGIKAEDAAKEEAEKVDMQPIPESMTRGWWRIVDPEQVKVYVEALHPRGVREKELSRMLTRFMDFAKDSCLKGNPKDLLLKEVKNADEVEMLGGAPLPDAEGSWSRETSLRGDMLLLEQIESLEDRIAAASMQVKGWKPPARITTEPNVEFRTSGETPPDSETDEREEEDDDDDEDEDDEDERPLRKPLQLGQGPINPIQVAKKRLLSVELAIERRYLKAPLGHCKGDIVQSVLSGAAPPSEPPKALLTWRDAVKKCETAAQVSMCFYVLETSVAWDKSIMKASCQFCHSGDKEDQLLLCDGCDKGYHTYCFRPPMDNIPDGDWFCFECRNKATGQRNCIVCGKPGNKSNCVLCDQCPKAFHIECHTPVLAKVPRGKWLCSLCHVKSPAKKKAAAKKTTNRDRVSESESASVIEEASSSSVLNDATPPASVAPAAPSPRRTATTAAKRKDSQASAKDKDLAPCRTILDQLEAHEEAWPFLLPVNTKQFPTYKKIIQKPMDLSTIRKKLNDGVYKTRDDFCADLQLMFVNCVTFNEDDSPVGKAGHSMKTFFDTRWAELIAH